MTCPRLEELSDFALGKLGEQSLEVVAEHLDACHQCQETVARLASDDTFVAKLKSLPDAPAPTVTLSPEPQAPGRSGVGQRSTGPAVLGIIGACQAASQRGVMNVSLAELAACVVDLECASNAEISTLIESLPADKREDSQELARSLVQAQKVTKFQATLLLKGQGKSLLMGDYVVLDRIGAGGMGQVFRARHRRMDRIVAVKVISSKALAKPDVVQRFQREVKAAARLIHPHIVTAFDAGEQNGAPYLVMELVEGPDLATVLKKQGPLPVGKTLELIQQAARGLAFAHAKGVVHRDVKPGNLLVGRDGVKILDMGLARLDDVNASAEQRAAAELTQDGDVMGTIDYMAPEQVVNTRNADAKSDVYSLGCTLFRLLTGKQLFAGQTLMECIMAHREQPAPAASTYRPEVPPAVDQLIQRMVAKRPDERPTMTDVVTAIDQLKRGAPVVLPPAASAVPVSAAAPQPTTAAQPVAIPQATSIPQAAAIPQATTIPAAVSHATAPSIPFTKSHAGQPPKRGGGLKWIAAAAGFLLVAFGVVVVIRDKDGNKVAEVNVPDGGSVTVDNGGETKSPPVEKQPSEMPTPAPVPATVPAQPAPPPTQPPSDNATVAAGDIERRATLWAQGKGAKIELWVGEEVVHIYSRTPPITAFHVRSIDFAESLDPNTEGRRTITDAMLQNLVGLERIAKLRLPYTRITDQGLAILGSLKTLETLDLTESAITDAGLAKLHNLKWLKSLNLSATQVTATGVAQLRAALPLCKVTPDALGGTTPATSPLPNAPVPSTVIPATPIATDYATERKAAEWVITAGGSVGVESNGVALNDIKSATGLPAGNFVIKTIFLYQRYNVSDADLINLRGLSRLNDLNLLHTATTDQGLAHLANLTSLEKLDLSHTKVTGSGVQQLSRLTSLTTLKLSSCPITDAGISTFPAFPSLTDFEMYRNGFSRLDCIRGMPKLQYVNIGDTAVRDLSPLADKGEMRKLNLWKTGVTDASLIHLKSLTKLRELQLNETAVTDAGLSHVESLPELIKLNLSKTPATQAGVQQFKQKRPACDVTWSPGTPAPIPVAAAPVVDPSLVCARLEAKRPPQQPSAEAIVFDAPRGDGRSGANGIVVMAPRNWNQAGTVWRFNYTFAGSAQGVHIIHPLGNGHVRVALLKDRVEVFTEGAYPQKIYEAKSPLALTIDQAASTKFPLQDNTTYAIDSVLEATGRFRFRIDQVLMCSTAITQTTPLRLTPPFEDPRAPATLVAGQAGVIIGPRDGGFNHAEDIHLYVLGSQPLPKAGTTTTPTPAPITVKVQPTPGGFFGEASPNTPLGGTADTRDPNRPRVDPPAADKLAEATKTVRELFKAEFAKKKPEEQRVLLTLLLGQGGATKDDLVGRFALLLEARNIAAELADVAGMTNAVASASDLHKIDEAEWLADGVDLALKKPIAATNAKQLAKYLDERVTLALNTDNFTGGKRLLDLAVSASRKAQDAALTKSLVERGKAFDAQKKTFEAIEKARATLKTSPDDTAANLTMGKYWCFVTGEWPLGLAALAKCDDAQIVELAKASLANPQTPAEQVALADQWWSKADKKTALTKFELQFAAAHWYQMAQGQADGLLKAKVEKRLTEAQEAIKVISRDARPERAAENTMASATPAPATVPSATTPITPAAAPKVPAIPANVTLLTPREIAAKVHAAGGRVMFTIGNGPEQTLAKIEDWPASGDVQIVLIDLITAPNFNDIDLVSMTNLPRLKRLTLQRSQITEASLAYLKKLPLLAFLDLGRNGRLGDGGWEHVGEMKQVTTISLIENRFTDAGLLKLKGLTDLKSMNLSNTLVTDRGLTVVSGMKGLTFVNLDTCAVNDASIDLIAECPLITNLLIAKTQVTDRCVPKLAQLKSLRDLNVRQTRISITAVEGLRRELPVAKVTY